jgi:hypothetical protein
VTVESWCLWVVSLVRSIYEKKWEIEEISDMCKGCEINRPKASSATVLMLCLIIMEENRKVRTRGALPGMRPAGAHDQLRSESLELRY